MFFLRFSLAFVSLINVRSLAVNRADREREEAVDDETRSSSARDDIVGEQILDAEQIISATDDATVSLPLAVDAARPAGAPQIKEVSERVSASSSEVYYEEPAMMISDTNAGERMEQKSGGIVSKEEEATASEDRITPSEIFSEKDRPTVRSENEEWPPLPDHVLSLTSIFDAVSGAGTHFDSCPSPPLTEEDEPRILGAPIISSAVSIINEAVANIVLSATPPSPELVLSPNNEPRMDSCATLSFSTFSAGDNEAGCHSTMNSLENLPLQVLRDEKISSAEISADGFVSDSARDRFFSDVARAEYYGDAAKESMLNTMKSHSSQRKMNEPPFEPLLPEIAERRHSEGAAGSSMEVDGCVGSGERWPGTPTGPPEEMLSEVPANCPPPGDADMDSLLRAGLRMTSVERGGFRQKWREACNRGSLQQYVERAMQRQQQEMEQIVVGALEGGERRRAPERQPGSLLRALT